MNTTTTHPLVDLKHDPDRPIGLMFSGGGARGAFQVGVWEVLSSDPRALRGRVPEIISGTSAGSINAALIAAGLSPKRMLEFWTDVSERPPIRANERFVDDLRASLRSIAAGELRRGVRLRSREANIFLRLLRKHRWYSRSGIASLILEFIMTARFDNVSTLLRGIRDPYVFNTEQIRSRLQDFIGSSTVPNRLGIKLAVNTVDVQSGSVVRIVNHRPNKRPGSARHYHYTPKIDLDMIVASASIPLLFNPVRVGHRTLWDGGLLVNSPMAPAVALGARRIIPVLVTTGGFEDEGKEIENFGIAVERLVDTFLENAYKIDRKLLFSRNTQAVLRGDDVYSVVDLFQAIRPLQRRLFDAGSYLYFERDHIHSMYLAGRSAALTWLGRGPNLDRPRS